MSTLRLANACSKPFDQIVPCRIAISETFFQRNRVERFEKVAQKFFTESFWLFLY